ncbi:MAG: extracellular solute-binding protein [Treponema sp.]|jgi:raffinose/stachyose/melibiose transport system substrate-binding protein|nr:extracellular solute-binding protein [Treponema sp.]
MKKLLGIAMASLLILPVFAGGAKDSSSSSGSNGKSIRVFQLKVEIDQPLKDYAKVYEQQTGVHVEIESAGGGADTQGVLKGYLASDNMPDIFVFEGPGQYKVWKDQMATLDSEKWAGDTSAAYKADGHVYGFPYAVEGYGLAYNADLLAKAGIDPAGLTTIDAYKAAFKKLDSMKDTLGINCVVAMAASVSTGMTWVTGNHNFGVYLSTGLKPGDEHVINDLLNGKVEPDRLAQYADWVKLLFDYSDKNVLLTGNYDQQVQLFTDQKAVFCHQGNWIDPNLEAAHITFTPGFAPHAFSHEVTDGIQVGAPSWWAVYKDGNVTEAKKFLEAFAESDAGRDARINKCAMISPFKSDTMKPKTPLAADVSNWVSKGKTYPWEQFKMPDGFGTDTLGPIYEMLANGSITTDQFVKMVTDAVAEIK